MQTRMTKLLYPNGQTYLNSAHKSVAIFGMSGLGKTRLASLLRRGGNWFHYSVDYRIGARYMAEPIADEFKREAMNVPLLRQLLMSDSVDIRANLRFDNLGALSNYVGKPGNPQKGGLSFGEYQRRQEEHRLAEIAAMKDIGHFQNRAREIYGYAHFVADCSGSLCEIIDLDAPKDALMDTLMDQLCQSTLPVWIEGDEADRNALLERFRAAPKPMYYRPQFLEAKWHEYLQLKSLREDEVEPDHFMAWGFEALIDDRLPRYRELAGRYGITISSREVETIESHEDFDALIAHRLDQHDH